MKSWGEEIWEDKAKTQGEVGVIRGTNSNFKQIHQETKEVMSMLDKEVLPLLKKGDKTMDLGCGPMARFSIEFAKRGFEPTGIDISEKGLSLAKKWIEKEKVKVTLKKDDISSLSKIKEKFDLVFCVETFGHIPSFLSLEALKNFNRITKKGKFCLIEFWTPEDKNFKNNLRYFIYWNLFLIKKRLSKTYLVNVSRYTHEEIEEMGKLSGFKIVKSWKKANSLFYLFQKK